MKNNVTTFYRNTMIFNVINGLSVILFGLVVLFTVCGWDRNIRDIIALFLCADLIVSGLTYLRIFTNSYLVRDNKIIMHDMFKKKVKEIEQISAIVVSNTKIAGQGIYTIKMKNLKGEKNPCPWITLFFFNPEKILKGKRECQNLSTFEVQGEWLANCTDEEMNLIFGFVFHKKTVKNILSHYRGKVYIAESVLINFQNEIEELIYKNLLNQNQISVIFDRKLKEQR